MPASFRMSLGASHVLLLHTQAAKLPVSLGLQPLQACCGHQASVLGSSQLLGCPSLRMWQDMKAYSASVPGVNLKRTQALVLIALGHPQSESISCEVAKRDLVKCNALCEHCAA